MHDESEQTASDLDAYLNDAALTEGQRRRLALFRVVEGGVCERIEALCEQSGIEVTDVAVLVIGPAAPEALWGIGGDGVINVVLGDRTRVYGLLRSLLPPPRGTALDPYGDLLARSPDGCVRVLIIDGDSLTVMSYGTFITVRLDPATMAVA